MRCLNDRQSQALEVDADENAAELLQLLRDADSSKFNDSGLGPSLRSSASYAETIMSYHGGQGGSIRIPTLPKTAKEGLPFHCRACGKMIIARTNSIRKQHLYRDLQPWQCLDTSCTFGNTFSTREDWVSHLSLDHGFAPKWPAMQCPLCLCDIGQGKSSILKHLGGHLEEISLVALPTDTEFDEISEAETDYNESDSEKVADQLTPKTTKAADHKLGHSTTDTQGSDQSSTASTAPDTTATERLDGFTILTQPGGFVCTFSGCTAAPFPTRYLLNSHAAVHSSARPYYCHVPSCSRSEGGKGFKRKNEMIRHGLVHESPGYICPFCPGREHKYPRPDNLKRYSFVDSVLAMSLTYTALLALPTYITNEEARHVRIHHADKDKDDPVLRGVLSQRPDGHTQTEATLETRTEPPDTDLADEKRLPISNDAVRYLDQVKAEYADDFETYNRFLSIMKDFKSHV